jgi:N-acetylmuramoyl-L-alanine amidase
LCTTKPGQRLFGVILLLGLVVFGLQVTPVFAKQGDVARLIHKVSSGQNLWGIAQEYGVNVKQIISWNNLDNPDRVYVGQTLYINSCKKTGEARISSNDLELLARLIHAEARGEDLEGQVAVGAVVLNRLKDPQFPKTLRDVIYQNGAFTAVRDQQIRLEPDETARRAAEAALEGVDPTGGALFYYNPSIARDKWIRTRPVIKVIGNHTFST